MNTQVVRPPSPPKRRNLDALRPVLMAAALVGVLVLAALLAAWLTGPSSSNAFTLTVLKPTGGTLTGSGITCGTGGTSCSTSVKDGQVVELRAEADEGYSFAGYMLDCAPSGRLEMKKAHSCGARFDRLVGSTSSTAATPDGRRWTLTLTPPENGTIVTLEGHECGTKKKACTAEVQEGTIVSLEVMPEDGYRVQSYTGDCVDGTANMTQARSCGVVLVKGEGPSVVPNRPPAPPPSPGPTRVASNPPSPAANQPRPEQTVAVAVPPTPSTLPEKTPTVTTGASPSGPSTPARPAEVPGPASTPPGPPPPARPAGGRRRSRSGGESGKR